MLSLHDTFKTYYSSIFSSSGKRDGNCSKYITAKSSSQPPSLHGARGMDQRQRPLLRHFGVPRLREGHLPTAHGEKPPQLQDTGHSAFTTPNQTLSARPPLPHFGLKSYFWAKFPLCIWEQLYSNLAQRLPCTLTELWPGLPIHSGCCTPFPSQPDGVWAKQGATHTME